MPPKNHISRFLIIPDDLGTILDTYIVAENIQSGALFTNIRKNRIKKCAIQNVFLASYTDKLVKAKKITKALYNADTSSCSYKLYANGRSI